MSELFLNACVDTYCTADGSGVTTTHASFTRCEQCFLERCHLNFGDYCQDGSMHEQCMRQQDLHQSVWEDLAGWTLTASSEWAGPSGDQDYTAGNLQLPTANPWRDNGAGENQWLTFAHSACVRKGWDVDEVGTVFTFVPCAE